MQPVQAGQRAGQEQAATVTGLLSRGFPRSQQPSFPTVTSCSDRPSASETARGEHTVKSHLVLLSSILVSFILFDQLWKKKQLDCETKYFVLWMLLSLRTIQREAVLKSTSPFKVIPGPFPKPH